MRRPARARRPAAAGSARRAAWRNAGLGGSPRMAHTRRDRTRRAAHGRRAGHAMTKTKGRAAGADGDRRNVEDGTTVGAVDDAAAPAAAARGRGDDDVEPKRVTRKGVVTAERPDADSDGGGGSPGCAADGGADEAGAPRRKKLKTEVYEAELAKLALELHKLEDWVTYRKPAGRRALRGPGRRRQGRRDQDDHRRAQPSRRTRRRPRRPHRAREDAVVFPALRGAPARGRRDGLLRPQLVQPRRRRARHGVLHGAEEYEEFLRSCPEFERMLDPLGDPAVQVLVLGERGGAGAAVRRAPRRPDEALEAQPDRPRVAHEVGGLLPGEGRDVRRTRTSSSRPGTS